MRNNFRKYYKNESISFRKTKEAFGGLSNMASGYPIVINDTYIRTSEALYQAMRFPDYPEIQKEIIEQKSPMTAKMISKKYRKEKTREDWDVKRIAIMKWCLRVKLLQNIEDFGALLLETENKNIVEESKKDKFWGAEIVNAESFEGINALGRLLMELREIHKKYTLEIVEPFHINNFRFYGKIIESITKDNKNNFQEKNIYSLFQCK